MTIQTPGFRIRASYEVAFSPDEEHLATLGRDVVLWGVSKRSRLRSTRLLRHPSEIAFSPSGRAFAVKNTSGAIMTCETSTADPLSHFTPDESDEGANVLYVAEETMLDASWTGEIRLRSTRDLGPRVLHRIEHTMITRVLKARDAEFYAFLASAQHTHPNFDQGADTVVVAPSLESGSFTTVSRRWRFLRDAALAPSAQILAVRFGTKEHVLETVNIANGQTLATTSVTQGGTGWAVGWSPEGTHIVLAERGGFSFREAETLREVAWMASPYAAAMAFAPNRGLLALGDWQTGLVVPWPGILETSEPRDASSLTRVRQN